MPKLDGDSMVMNTGSFQFSGVRPEMLGATEYTLVTLILDISGSVDAYKKDLVNMAKAVVQACKKSPRAENLLLRRVDFSNDVNEFHGFKPLSLIDENTYDNFNCGGMTALFDATYSSVAATLKYGKTLIDQDFSVNGICFIITDGEDNNSNVTPLQVKNQMGIAIQGEDIESLLTILIGVNDNSYKSYLETFKDEANLSQYVSVGDATAQKLAKLAAFVSKSISSQSQSLGSGGASQLLTF